MKIQDSEFGKVIDISPVLNRSIAVFPGDEAFTRTVTLDCKRGDLFTLSAVNTTLHVGAHADAPSHYDGRGASIEKRPLEYYLGKAQVVHVRVPPGERIGLKHWGEQKVLAPRVLFRTHSFPDTSYWNEEFNSLSEELIDFLAGHKVKLVGIDTPSIDPATDRTFESHHAVYRHNLAVLEGIVLTDVPEGVYRLIALPLPIEDGDASPVRAVLLEGGP